jgi:polar amino acid transport system permease protein
MSAFELLFGTDGWWYHLAQGTVITVALALTTVPFGFGGGLMLAVAKMSKSRTVRAVCDAYTTFFRGIPDILALFIIYFGLQALIDRIGTLLQLPFHLELNTFCAGVIALSVVAAAYSSEVWISALAAVPPGQAEAAKSLGLHRNQVFFLVTVPQLARVALPGLGNIWTVVMKDTSLVSTLALMDLLRASSEAARATARPLVFYSAACAVYMIFSLISFQGINFVERRANRGYAA